MVPVRIRSMSAPSEKLVYLYLLISQPQSFTTIRRAMALNRRTVDQDLVRLIADHVLASSMTVGRIAARAGVKRLALVHIKEKSEELLRSMIEEIGRDFDGEVIVGEVLMEIEV